jgi:hypothetical protein
VTTGDDSQRLRDPPDDVVHRPQVRGGQPEDGPTGGDETPEPRVVPDHLEAVDVVRALVLDHDLGLGPGQVHARQPRAALHHLVLRYRFGESAQDAGHPHPGLGRGLAPGIDEVERATYPLPPQRPALRSRSWSNPAVVASPPRSIASSTPTAVGTVSSTARSQAVRSGEVTGRSSLERTTSRSPSWVRWTRTPFGPVHVSGGGMTTVTGSP